MAGDGRAANLGPARPEPPRRGRPRGRGGGPASPGAPLPDHSEKTLIAGRPVRYRVRRSDRARRPSVHVDHRDGVVVVLPRRAPLREVPLLLQAHAAWIDQQVERYGVREGPVRRRWVDGSPLPVLGRPRRLCLAPLPDGRRRARLRLREDRLEAELPPTLLLDPRPALERWLRALARAHLAERVRELSDLIGLAPARVIVGERVSRWGSCSTSGTLSFCYRLVMAPPEVIDAVVAHEICHLRHLNHGRRFHRLLRLACPGYEARMAWLRDHEADLQL